MADLSTFGPKDRKIIIENPGKSPYELAELGLTNKAFERMLAGEMPELDAPSPISPPVPIEIPKSNIVQPASVRKVENKVQLTSPKQYAQQKVSGKTGQVKVLNRRTGKIVKISANAAQRLMKNPNLYQLL